MSLFSDLVNLFSGATVIRDEYTGISIAEMRGIIQQQPALRFYVDDTANFGHQATTVNIMKRIIDTTGYTGAIVIVYAGKAATANKLAVLLPGLDPAKIETTKIKYGTCENITFKPWEKRGELDDVTYAFTGGADNMKINYAAELKATYFLRLEPYLWEMLNKSTKTTSAVQRPGLPDFNLSDQSVQFNSLAYKFTPDSVAEVPVASWEWYTKQTFDPKLAIRSTNAMAIYDAWKAYPDSMTIWPVYGLHQFTSEASEICLNMVLAALNIQKATAKAPVIVHFSDPARVEFFQYLTAFAQDLNRKDRTLPALKKAISDAYIDMESFGLPAAYSAANLENVMVRLREYVAPSFDNNCTLTLLNGYPKEKYTNIANPIFKALTNPAANQIFVIVIGAVPQDVYNYFFANGNLPGIFEGQGSSSLPISLGKPFMQMPKKAMSDAANYPSTLSAENFSDMAQYCKSSVLELRDLRFIEYLRIESPLPSKGYTSSLNEISAFVTKAIKPKNIVNDYFVGLGNYYQKDIHDKLMMGLVAVDSLVLVSRKRLTGEKGLLHEAAEQTPLTLQQVYDQLLANWNNGSINLLKALPQTYLTGFFAKVTGNAFDIAVDKQNIVAEKDKDDKIISVTVKEATTASFLGITMRIALVYTAEYGPVITEVTAIAGQVWTMDGIPWILFKNPGFRMKVNEGGFPVQGGILGTIQSYDTDVNLEIEYPVGDNTWLLSAAFEGQYPGIATIFQAAGGINLVQVLPAPLSQLAGFGLQQAQLMYNSAAFRFDYMSFAMTTNSPWTISTNPLFTITPTVQVSVYNVADLNKRRIEYLVTGTFVIGKGTIAVTGGYPDFRIYGGLSEGRIELSDLLALFGGELDLATSVTEFNYDYAPAKKYYQIGALLEPDKPLVIANIFSIDNLSFNVNSNNAINSVFLGGQITVLPDTAQIGMQLSALYATGKGWTFAGKQTSGVIKIGSLLTYYINNDWAPPENYDYGIDGLSFTINSLTGYWEFGAKTALPWNIEFLNLTVSGNALVAYGKKEPDQPAGYYGNVSADIIWNNIHLTAFYDFEPGYKAYGITWGMLTGKVVEKIVDGKPHQQATLSFTKSTTLGSIVETMVSWVTGNTFGLAAPWNILNSIPLNNLSLTYDFTSEQVSFSVGIGPINMGFAVINGISISYNTKDPKPENNGVIVSLIVSSSWANIPSWDAAKPESTPAPPGQGNQYLDLRLLAMGQHVTLPCFKTADNVQAAIACMSQLPKPEAGKIPPVQLDSNSSWLIGIDMGLLKLDSKKANALALAADGPQYFITLQTVFNDPNLYALRIALEGEPAKIFKGLDFQIMYKKISDSVGVYQAEIALPEIMRKINMGQFNITLPVFGIAVFTNGDFQVDIGFPWKQDFSRSFTFQTLIWTPVGIPIPVMGSAGVYFGKLSSATTNRVPTSTIGTFNPVLVFGFGVQFGIGYDFSVGILKAGFSLTAVAILEGILAKFNPYDAPKGSGNNTQLETSYYFWFRGTVGIIGKLYGTVDFAIVKAELNIDIRLLAQMTFAPYEYIEISIIASVSVSLKITINLGLFKIKISFSFSARIQEGITIKGIGGTAPWASPALPAAGMPALQRSRRWRYEHTELLAAYASVTPVWQNLKAPAVPAPMTAYAALALTMAGDNAAQPANQLPCYVAMLFIASVPPPQEDRNNGVLKAFGDNSDTSFEFLCKQVFRWAIAAIQSVPMTSAQVDALIVSDLQLAALQDYLSNPANPTPIAVDDINRFMAGQFAFTVNAPESGEADATYFPVPPDMALNLPAYGSDYHGLTYDFAGYNSTSADYTQFLRSYFNQLAVQVAKDPANDNLQAWQLNDSTGVSVGSFVYSDYFLLILRQMLQSVRDSLKDFKYYATNTQTVNDIVDWVNNHSGANTYTVETLFTDNVSAGLSGAKTLRITGCTYIVQAGDTFSNIAAKTIFNGGFTGKQLASANENTPNTLQAGIEINYPGRLYPYKTLPGQSLSDVAAAMHISVSDLIDNSNIATLPGLLLPVATLATPAFNYNTVTGDTLNKIAAQYNITQQQLAAPAENGLIAGLFDQNVQAYLNIAHLQQFMVGDLISEIQATNGLQNLSGMTSRYYMAGLRLPTQGITPRVEGMWVTNNNGVLHLPDYAGLYALTGQQFALPNLNKTDTFTITLSRPAGLSWLSFANSDPAQLPLPVVPGSYNARQITAVKNFATTQALNIPLHSLGAQESFITDAASYPFTSQINWNSASAFPMPYGGYPGGVPALSLWPLPDTLLQLPDPETRKVNPRVKMQKGRYDESSRTMVNTPIAYYGYGSLVAFTVKKVPAVPESPNTLTTYEIMGADGSNAELLEKMVSGIGNDNSSIATLIVAYDTDSNGTTPEGIQTDAPVDLTLGIAQVNLSTETRPDTFTASVQMTTEEQSQMVLLNESSAFVRLLWQAGITRGGGYYLYYFNAGSGGGLPDRIFNDKNEAVLSLLVLYTAATDDAARNNVTDFMNVLATGEAINTSDTVLFAEADPFLHIVASNSTQTLSALAYDYYGNVADVAADNALLTLRKGISLLVSEGVYEVRPAGMPPGGDLQAIATWFGTTPEAIQLANPLQTEWPNPLPLYTALYLPPVTVVVGTGNGGSTLQSIAEWYGETPASLGAKNQLVPGIFTDNQTIILKGGPDIRCATVPPGVAGIAASRAIPAPIPENPDAENYGELFLLNTYNLLSYQVADNNYFSVSNLGLPASPTAETDDNGTPDKMNYPRELTETDNWEYSQSIPYSQFAKHTVRRAGDMPSPANSPYRGLGGLLQVDFAWQDLYGNRLITTLSQPTGSSQLNKPPLLTGYTDALLGLNQWPSVAASWEVNTIMPSAAQLQLNFSFGDSYYQGLLSAKVIDSNHIDCLFTQTLDEASAIDPANYSIDHDIKITGFSIGADKQTVTLQVDNVPEGKLISVSINNIYNSNKKQNYTGSAQFDTPETPGIATSTLIAQAGKDLQVYTNLWYQLTDPNGISYSVNTSLLQNGYTLGDAQVNALVQLWISSIYLFLQNRSKGLTDVPAPAASFPLVFAIDATKLNSSQLFRLNCSFSITRTRNQAAGDFETTGGILQATTQVAALSDPEGGNTHSFDLFAQRFEAALFQPGKQSLRIATGNDREAAGNSKELWAVRLGLDKQSPSPIAYTITDAGNPDMFAPRPISNKLESRPQVPIYYYSEKDGINFDTPSTRLDFNAVDMDLWGQQFFSNVDDVLSPEFTAAIQLVDQKKKTAYLEGLLESKKTLADIVQQWMIPLFAGETANAAVVQEAFKQLLLNRLSNAYTVQAAIQYHAGVSADTGTGIAPRLYGNINRNFKLMGAMVQANDNTIVSLLFTTPPDPTAVTAGNFTISDGPVVERANPDPQNNRRVILQLSDKAVPGSSTVTVSNSFTDQTGNLLMPPLTTLITTNINEGNNSNAITFTSPKLPLAPATNAPLPFLISSPQIVRGSGNELLKYVDLDLNFSGSAIEHQIGQLPNIAGYEASTWLSFVTAPGNNNPLKENLCPDKPIQVPIVLREFPTAPSMVNQSGGADQPNNGSDISQLLNWHYTIAYSLPIHYPQDQLNFTVNFNVADYKNLRLMGGIEDAFPQLAEFITIAPSVYAVLQKQLTQVKADTPDNDPILDTAATALRSYNELVAHIVTAAQHNGLFMAAPQLKQGSNEVLPYLFYIEEGSETIDDVQALIVSVHGVPPDGIGTPRVNIPGYEHQVYTGSCTGDYCYYYTKDGAVLPASEGQTIPERSILLPGMNILARQDAATTAQVKRNAILVPGKPCSEPFIYTTGTVEFANPLHPTNDCVVPVDISQINAPHGQNNYAPLSTQLTNLFNALLKENSQQTLSFLMSCSYTYQLNTMVDAISLPVIMQPLQSIEVKVDADAGAEKTLEQMISDWAGSIIDWQRINHPDTSKASLWFDLTIYSNLTQQPLPLVRLRLLYLEIQYITDFDKI